MKTSFQAPPIESIDQLVQILNSKNELLNEAHKLQSDISFEPFLVSFFIFRETMLENTEEFLQHFVPALSTMDGIKRRLEGAIAVSMGLCLSPSNPYTYNSLRLTEEDAYKARYLLEYLSFLKELRNLIARYLEYSMDYSVDLLQGFNSEAGLPFLGGNTLLEPEVKGIEVNQSEAIPEDSDFREFKKNLDSDDRKAYRLSIIYVILKERSGWTKFLEPLTFQGRDQLYAEITDASERYSAAIKNEEKKYPWEKYSPYARFFLDSLPRFKRKNL